MRFPLLELLKVLCEHWQRCNRLSLFIYECHANTGPVEIAAKVFDTCHRHLAAIREIKQLTETLRYQTILCTISSQNGQSVK